MSKAFTKEDDDAGFVLVPGASTSTPTGPFRLTTTGARRLRATRPDVLVRAEVLEAQPASPPRAALGVTVTVEPTDGGSQRAYRLVSEEERALLGEGCSVGSPIGRALLGAGVGEVRELRAPRGTEEVTVVALRGELPPPSA